MLARAGTTFLGRSLKKQKTKNTPHLLFIGYKWQNFGFNHISSERLSAVYFKDFANVPEKSFSAIWIVSQKPEIFCRHNAMFLMDPCVVHNKPMHYGSGMRPVTVYGYSGVKQLGNGLLLFGFTCSAYKRGIQPTNHQIAFEADM